MGWLPCWIRSSISTAYSCSVIRTRFRTFTIGDSTARMSSSTCESATHRGAVCGRGSPIWVIRPVQRQAGLLNAAGKDAFVQRIVFPLEGNLYGRSIRGSAPHLFLPGSKGGLYGWERVRQCPEVILVEGLFDYAVLWQAGFQHVTCSIGSHLNARQFQQLCDGRRIVYLAFDSDQNQSGQLAAQSMSRRLWAQGVTARRVQLSVGHDPNSFFVEGGDAHQFQRLLEAARP